MTPIGIYYAYWTHHWDADFVPFVSRVKALGFDLLEVNAGTVTRLSHTERDRLKGAAQDEGIELVYCIGLPHAFDVASEDASVRRAGIAYLQDMARMLKYMGHRQLGGIIYSSWPGKPAMDADKRAALDRSVASMREVMKTAEDCGACFNVEVVNRFEQYLLNTAAEGVDYVERVGSPNCRVLLDTFHLNIEEDDLRQAIVSTGDKLGHFHLGETNRRPPGRGRMPWDEIFGALHEICYPGAVSMEPFLMPGGEVGRDISVYRDMRGSLDLDGEAKRSVDFVRQQLVRAAGDVAQG